MTSTLTGNELREHRGEVGPLAPSGPAFDHEVLSRYPVQLAQALEECVVVRVRGDRDADPGDLPRRLRLGGERRGDEG